MGNPTEPKAQGLLKLSPSYLKTIVVAILYMKQRHERKKNEKPWIWSIKILILAISLSLIFSVVSEIALSKTAIIISIIIILVFIALSILFDVLGLAVASSNVEHFAAMASRKVKGSRQAMALNKNADKVASICDVICDVCGVLSGAGGASILTRITMNGELMDIVISSLVSAIIAGLTIFGKSKFKKYSLVHSNKITLKFAKFINFFTKKD